MSLLEVLLAAALLAMVVAACLPLLSVTTPGAAFYPDPQLARIAEAAPIVVPPNASFQRFESLVADEIEGVWVVVISGDRVALVWSLLDPQTLGGRP